MENKKHRESDGYLRGDPGQLRSRRAIGRGTRGEESGEWRHGGGDKTRLVMEQLRLVRGEREKRADHF